MAQQDAPRGIVLDILMQVTRDGVFSHIALRQALSAHPGLSRKERAFITRCTEGTIERMIELDYILNTYSKTPVNKMKPVIRCILRSALYEILYMDSVPDSAACNEAVKLTQKRGLSGLKGFVNGILRNIIRNKAHLKYPDPAQHLLQALSVRYSMPEWLLARFQKQYGRAKCEAILKSFYVKRPVTARVDTGRISPEEFTGRMRAHGVKAVPLGHQAAFALSGYDRLQELPEFTEGLFYLQDVASMQAVDSVDFARLIAEARGRPVRVLDVCAAPGGKSIQAAWMLRDAGMVTARDLSEAKVALIRENSLRCRTGNLTAQVRDALCYDPDCGERMDLVIADLPCSGLGVLARKTDIKYRAGEEQIKELAGLQQRILSVACRYVRPGGILLYSTCTLTPEENTCNTAAFLQSHPSFALLTEQEITPDQGCDGFYIAQMIRRRADRIQAE